MARARKAGTGPICVAILRCSVAALLGVALLRLRCLSSLDEGSRASSRSQLGPVPAARQLSLRNVIRSIDANRPSAIAARGLACRLLIAYGRLEFALSLVCERGWSLPAPVVRTEPFCARGVPAVTTRARTRDKGEFDAHRERTRGDARTRRPGDRGERMPLRPAPGSQPIRPSDP